LQSWVGTRLAGDVVLVAADRAPQLRAVDSELNCMLLMALHLFRGGLEQLAYDWVSSRSDGAASGRTTHALLPVLVSSFAKQTCCQH
jgi:hypothetical protein